MSQKRRDFLKLGGLAGAGLLLGGVVGESRANSLEESIARQQRKKAQQRFNMSGYAADKIDTVRIAFIGLGHRGPGAVNRIKNIENVEIKALCDIRQERVRKVHQSLQGTGHEPDLYFAGAYDWKKICERPDIDLVYICTPWDWHVPMAVFGMEQGKHVAVEVPAATTLEGCWELVETSEKTKKHCMMLENCCYDFFELLTLNMAREGFFGEIIHGEGAYIHDLLGLNFDKEGYYNMWRLKENYRNGNLYPTHGLGPICQAMNINRGDQMDYLVSTASADFHMEAKAKELADNDDFFAGFANHQYRGNMNTTTVRTKKGRTIMIQHDVTSPRPYSRIHLLSGTKGVARKYPGPARIGMGHKWASEEEMEQWKQKYTPDIVKKVGEMAKKIGGHGGMDFMMDWRLIDCLRNGLPLDQDVYDAALWSSIAPLSEWSVANRSNSVDVPDFTAGAWKQNSPVNLTLEGGGNTGVKQLKG